MTEFAERVMKWGCHVDAFTEQEVKDEFRNICGRNRRATLLGLVVCGYVNMSTKKDGSHIYWVNKAVAEMLKIG